MHFVHRLPDMLFRVSDSRFAILTVRDMRAITQIYAGCVLVGTCLYKPAAAAHIAQGTVSVFYGFHLVVNVITAIHSSHAISGGIAVTGSTATHIPAIGQSIT